MNRTIQHKGMLAVASPWRPDYDNPVMGRVVWGSAHKWEPCYNDLPVDGQCAQNNKQRWTIFLGNGQMVGFTTPEYGEYETGAAIKPPHKRKGQSRPWTYKSRDGTEGGTGSSGPSESAMLSRLTLAGGILYCGHCGARVITNKATITCRMCKRTAVFPAKATT